MAIDPAPQIFLDLMSHGIGGQGDDRASGTPGFGLMRADQRHRLEPAHHRHVHIHQHQVEPAAPPLCNRLGAVPDHGQLERIGLEQMVQHQPVGPVVLGRENPPGSGAQYGLGLARAEQAGGLGGIGGDKTERSDKDGTAVRRAVKHQVARHQRADSPGDPQAQPGAAMAAGDRGIGLRERLEQPVALVGRHPGTGVADPHLEPRARFRR